MRYDAHDIAVMMRVNRIIGGFYWMNAGTADGTADIGDRVTDIRLHIPLEPEVLGEPLPRGIRRGRT
jgi:hypothetical protein